MPFPLIALAVGALAGRKTKEESKKDFIAVKGKKRKDGSESKPHIRTKTKSR
jgi:hypothetical protein